MTIKQAVEDGIDAGITSFARDFGVIRKSKFLRKLDKFLERTKHFMAATLFIALAAREIEKTFEE